MSRLILPTVALVLAAPSGAAEKVTERDRFELWNDCRTMRLEVGELHKDATDIGLTKDAITVAVRSRLRAARLYTADRGGPFLWVAVTVYGSAFGVRVSYFKLVKDRASGISSGTGTWVRGSTGKHGRDASYILSSVTQDADEFLDEYLRVNADACGQSN